MPIPPPAAFTRYIIYPTIYTLVISLQYGDTMRVVLGIGGGSPGHPC